MSRTFLGQNFLVDTQVQQRICDAFKPEGDFGEIGPGRGAITQHLEKKYDEFWVFEKDPKMADLYRTRTKIHLVEGDFVDWDFKLGGIPVEDFSLVGNLPYESGTKMVLRVVEQMPQIKHFVFMLQKEVVDRLCAKPRTSDFGSLSVLVQTFYHLESLFLVPPSAFRPAPKVDSKVVRAFRRPDAPAVDRAFLKFVHSCFLHKRKMLKNSLRSRFSPDRVAESLRKLGLSDTVRAEEIPVDLWPRFFGDLAHEQAAR